MAGTIHIWQQPTVSEVYLIAGWRQWADAGALSSGLPQYLIKQLRAERIGELRPDGFYLFQIPGTHDLMRPVVRLNEGLPQEMTTRRNDFYYAQQGDKGLVVFLGEEPHMDADRYAAAFLEAARSLGVRRIISLGGVYGEFPYDRERRVACLFSLPKLKEELDGYAVDFSNYHGGASIGSYISWKSAESAQEFVGLYAFVPMYDVSRFVPNSQSVHIETDYTAWLGILRRINHMFSLELDLTDLERRSQELIRALNAQIDELAKSATAPGLHTYIEQLSDAFDEAAFPPLDDIWEEGLRDLFNDFDAEV